MMKPRKTRKDKGKKRTKYLKVGGVLATAGLLGAKAGSLAGNQIGKNILKKSRNRFDELSDRIFTRAVWRYPNMGKLSDEVFKAKTRRVVRNNERVFKQVERIKNSLDQKQKLFKYTGLVLGTGAGVGSAALLLNKYRKLKKKSKNKK